MPIMKTIIMSTNGKLKPFLFMLPLLLQGTNRIENPRETYYQEQKTDLPYQ